MTRAKLPRKPDPAGPPRGDRPEPLTRILAAARQAAAGEAAAPAALIEAPDRELLRALRRATPAERDGLLQLLGKLGARGRRVAEEALANDSIGDDVLEAVLRLLRERQPEHALLAAYDGLGPSLDQGDPERAERSFRGLTRPLARLWARREATRRLGQPTAALRQWLEASPEATACLLDGLDVSTPAETLEAMATLANGSTSRGLQKAVRATFYRLAQRGLRVPELSHAAEPAPAGEPRPEARAFLSAADPDGDQAVWILEALPEGGYSVLQAVCGDDGCLHGARAFGVARRGFDSLLKTLETGEGLPLAPLDPAEAIGLVEEAYARNPLAAPPDYVSWRRARDADRRSRRPVRADISPDERARLAARAGELLDLVPCSTWLLLRGETEMAEKQLSETGESPLVLPPAETAARREAAIGKTLDLLYGSQRRGRLARRLEGTALVFDRRGEAEPARIALATAAALRDGDPAARPLLAGLLERSLEALGRLRRTESRPEGAGEALTPGSESPGA